eukprot:2924870-Prorocentrum_lima.AAC.1
MVRGSQVTERTRWIATQAIGRSSLLYGSDTWFNLTDAQKKALIDMDMKLQHFANKTKVTGNEEWAKGGQRWCQHYEDT